MPRNIIELRVHKDTTNENWLEKKSHVILHFCKHSIGLVVLIKYSLSIFIGHKMVNSDRFCRDLGKVLFFLRPFSILLNRADFEFSGADFVFFESKLVRPGLNFLGEILFFLQPI